MSAAFGTKQISADQHASLAAPARDRSITVDDFIEQPAQADPESDSDADENEPAVTPAQKRPRSSIRRSSSALSFESEAEEDEEQPPAKRQRSDPPVAPSSSSRVPSAAPAPSPPHIQLPTSPPQVTSRGTGFFSGHSPLSPKTKSLTAFFNVTNARKQPNPLPQPLNSPKLTTSIPPPSISSHVFPRSPRSPNAPPLSVDPSAPSNPTPPRTTAPVAQRGSASPAPSPASPQEGKSTDTPPVKHSPAAVVSSTPSVNRTNSRVDADTTVSPNKRSSPPIRRVSISSKVPEETTTSLVLADPKPIATSQKAPSPPAPKPPQLPPPKSTPAAPVTAFASTANYQHSGGRPPTGASANQTPSSPQPNSPDTIPSVQERNSPMHVPVPPLVPPTGSNPSQPVRAIPGHANLPPLSHDDLINVRMAKPADGGDWDRFVFFKHRPQRHDFGKNCYLSDYSPFAAVAPAVANEPPCTLCAVCGGGSRLVRCSGCVCAFHAKCLAPYQVTAAPWYCKGCRSAGLPNDNPTPIPDPPSNLSLAAQALHRAIIDAREGNPIDLVLHPSLLTMFRGQYAGRDWLQCFSCKRRRVVPNGILSESVQIPFECSAMFWLPPDQRSCSSQKDPNTQRIEQYINQQAELRGERRKALLESFGDGSDDDSEYSLQSDPSNVKLSARPSVPRPEQPNNPVANHTVIPNGISKQDAAPKTVPPPQSSTERVIEHDQAASAQNPTHKDSTTNGFAPMEVDTIVPKEPNHSDAKPAPAPTVNAVASITTTQQPSATQAPLTSTSQETSHAGTPQTKTESAKQEDNIGGSTTKPEDVEQELLMYIAELELDEETEDILTDLALSNDKTLTQIYIAFRSNKDRFKRQAVRYAKRKAKTS